MPDDVKISEEIRLKVEMFFATRPSSLSDLLGVRYVELDKKRVVATMPVSAQNKQPFGILHGGASVALAETLASIGGWLNIDEQRFNAVGLEINANHLRPVIQGLVTGSAVPLHLGRTTQVWQIDIVNEAGKPVCISRCTLAIVPKG